MRYYIPNYRITYTYHAQTFPGADDIIQHSDVLARDEQHARTMLLPHCKILKIEKI